MKQTKTDAEAPRPDKLLYTIDEAAAMLNLARSYVYAGLVTPGILRSCKVGRRRLVAKQDLEDYLNRLRGCGSVA